MNYVPYQSQHSKLNGDVETSNRVHLDNNESPHPMFEGEFIGKKDLHCCEVLVLDS